jgi:hypothetical protein
LMDLAWVRRLQHRPNGRVRSESAIWALTRIRQSLGCS